MAKPKRPRDLNQLAKFIVDASTGNLPPETGPVKNPAAVAMGKLGGAKGGPARAAAALSPAKRKAIAKKAAAKRWASKRKQI